VTRGIIIACVVVLILCLMPMFGVMWSSWFADRHGCTLNESGYHPCVVDGEDWGGLLGGAFIAGWFMLLTIPVGALTLLVLIVTLIIRWIRKCRAARQG